MGVEGMSGCLFCDDRGLIVRHENDDGKLTVHFTPCTCERGKAMRDYLSQNAVEFRLPDIEAPKPSRYEA